MAITITQLFAPVQLSTSVAVIYSMPTNPATYTLKNARVRVTNTSNAAVAVSLWMDKAANASTAANAFLFNYSLGPTASAEFDVPTMSAGDTFRGQAGAATQVTIHEMGGTLFY